MFWPPWVVGKQGVAHEPAHCQELTPFLVLGLQTGLLGAAAAFILVNLSFQVGPWDCTLDTPYWDCR